MRTHRTLIFSLALNMVLAAAWLVLRELPANAPAGLAIATAAKSSEPALVASNVPPVPANTNPVVLPFNWGRLETEDLRLFAGNLKTVGCPEHVFRALLISKLERHYQPQLRTPAVYYDPWVGEDRREADRRTERVRESRLRREQAALVRELLGYDWNSEAAREFHREEMAGVFLGFLSDLKAQQVMAHVMTSLQGMEDQFSFFESRIFIEEDRQRFAQFRSGISQQLGGLLTPQELDELETRSQLGLILMNVVYIEGMEPTGAELRAIMHASRGYRDFFSMVLFERHWRDRDSEPDSERREFETAIAASLGAARLADFQRAQEKDFREAFEFTKQQSLPRALAVKLYEAQRVAESQRREIDADVSLSEGERKAALDVLQNATMASIATSLGKQFTNYFNGNGRWLRQLASTTAAKSGTQEYRR